MIVDHFDNEPEVSCDNCMKPQLPHKEYTTEAINVCQCLEEMIAVNSKVNVKQLALTFKGSK